MKNLLILFILLLNLNCILAENVFTNITVGWTPSLSSGVGYYIYYDFVKNMPTRNTVKIDVGTNTTYTISNINSSMSVYMYGTSYYLVNHIESIPSNVIQIFKGGRFTLLSKPKN